MANENAIQATGTFVTRKGLSLITKLVAAKGTLSFSRGAVGVGRPPEGYSPDSMIALSSYKMDAEIADYGVQDDKAFVTIQISSDQVDEGFLLTEVGLYATDPDEGEVLYAYMDISTDPTYIYANGSANRTKFAEFTLYVLIGTVERVTAAVTPGSIITKDTFKADKLPVSDTSGILGEVGKAVTGQEMFDALTHKVVEELVTNNDLIATLASYVTTEALTTKLAEYILKNKIVDNFLATSADTVLSGTMGAELKRLLDVLNTNLKFYDWDKINTSTPDYVDTSPRLKIFGVNGWNSDYAKYTPTPDIKSMWVVVHIPVQPDGGVTQQWISAGTGMVHTRVYINGQWSDFNALLGANTNMGTVQFSKIGVTQDADGYHMHIYDEGNTWIAKIT